MFHLLELLWLHILLNIHAQHTVWYERTIFLENNPCVVFNRKIKVAICLNSVSWAALCVWTYSSTFRVPNFTLFRRKYFFFSYSHLFISLLFCFVLLNPAFSHEHRRIVFQTRQRGIVSAIRPQSAHLDHRDEGAQPARARDIRVQRQRALFLGSPLAVADVFLWLADTASCIGIEYSQLHFFHLITRNGFTLYRADYISFFF